MRFLQRPSLSLLLLSGMVGLLIGLGSYTFIYRARRMNNLSLPVIFSVRPSSGSTLSFQRIRSASTRIKKPHEYLGEAIDYARQGQLELAKLPDVSAQR